MVGIVLVETNFLLTRFIATMILNIFVNNVNVISIDIISFNHMESEDILLNGRTPEYKLQLSS